MIERAPGGAGLNSLYPREKGVGDWGLGIGVVCSRVPALARGPGAAETVARAMRTLDEGRMTGKILAVDTEGERLEGEGASR